MAKIVIDENLKGKELFDFLIANKSGLISQKKEFPKKTDAVTSDVSFVYTRDGKAEKTAVGDIPANATSVRAIFVANTALWFDSQKDVLIPDCWKKTVKDGNGRIHIKDHNYELDAEVGDVVNIFSQDISLSQLGLSRPGTTQSLVYESDVRKDYDEKVFNKYRKGKINQHSIGLRYVKIYLAINNEDYKEEFAVWNKYIDQIINKEEAEEAGYFWAVTEIKLIEVSAVLLGANILTPTLIVNSTDSQPSSDTDDQPQKFDLEKAILETKFFN